MRQEQASTMQLLSLLCHPVNGWSFTSALLSHPILNIVPRIHWPQTWMHSKLIICSSFWFYNLLSKIIYPCHHLNRQLFILTLCPLVLGFPGLTNAFLALILSTASLSRMCFSGISLSFFDTVGGRFCACHPFCVVLSNRNSTGIIFEHWICT